MLRGKFFEEIHPSSFGQVRGPIRNSWNTKAVTTVAATPIGIIIQDEVEEEADEDEGNHLEGIYIPKITMKIMLTDPTVGEEADLQVIVYQ